jgi:hypothetical protein
MPGLLHSSSSSLAVNFDSITAGHTVDVRTLQLLPETSGGRKIRAQMVIDVAGAAISFNMTIIYRDIAFEELGLQGETMSPQAKSLLVNKY